MSLLKTHNIGTHLEGIETSFQVVYVPLFLKSFHFWVSYITFWKELFPFNLKFPFVICSVSILVDTASSVFSPLKAGWNCAKSCMHELLLPKHNLGYDMNWRGEFP
jgi:hypothetical protein